MITSLVEILRLDEVRGRIRNLDSILDSFQNIFQKKLKSVSEYPVQIKITEKDFGLENNFFFSKILVTVNIRAGFSTKATGTIQTDNLTLDSNKKLTNVRIVLDGVRDLRDSEETFVDQVVSDFSHEITHAYEEYERILSKAPSLDAKDYRTKYAKIRQEAESVPEHIVKSVLYFTDRVEQKAFLGELYNEARKFVKQGYSGNDLYKVVLKNSQAGKSYLNCKQLMGFWEDREKFHGESIWDLADRETPDWKEKLIQVWNDIYGTSVMSVGDIRIKLSRIWNKFESVFKTKLGKVVHDASSQWK